MSAPQGSVVAEVPAFGPTATTVSPAPRSLILLVAAIGVWLRAPKRDIAHPATP